MRLVYDPDKMGGHEFEDAMAEVFQKDGVQRRARKAFKRPWEGLRSA